ncbi:MAG TPA: MASE1 domain-containing protein [Phycisphaerae bacterium]
MENAAQHAPQNSRAAFSVTTGLRYLVTLAAVAALYFVAAKFGLSLAAVAPQVSPVWPPTGIALAALLIFGYRVWPGITLAALCVNAQAQEPLATAAGIAVGNTLEALTGAFVLQRVVGFRPSMERLRDVIGLALGSAVVSTTVSATIGVSSLCLGQVNHWDRFRQLWLTWWLGDAMGALVIAPMLLTWRARFPRIIARGRAAETVVAFGLLLVAARFIFGGPLGETLQLKFLCFPFFIWMALRLGQPVTAAATVVVSALAVWGARQHAGNIPIDVLNHQLILLQTFMGVLSVGSLALGAVLMERQRAEEALRQYRQHLEQLVAERTDALNHSQEQLRRAERLASIGTLVTGIAHEINNPLNSILLTAQYALLAGSELDSAGALKTITQEAQRGGRIVKSMLKFAGAEPTPKAPTDLNEVVRHAGELVGSYRRAGRLHIEFDLAADVPPVIVNATEIEQVLVNLIKNAAESTEAAVRVVVRTRLAEGFAQILVSDNGPGIPREILPQIFDPFFTTKRRLGGTGLGLSICHGIISDHGGTLTVANNPEGGTVFDVRLPLADSDSHSPTKSVQ